MLFSEYAFVVESFLAGLAASIACGLGALPVLFRRYDPETEIALGYSFAGGLMFAASVYNLLLPAFTHGMQQGLTLLAVLQTLAGLLFGCIFIYWVNGQLSEERIQRSPFFRALGGRTAVLVFVAMTFHSIPEGVAVGVGFAAQTHYESLSGLGWYIALAISIHNMPEGLAVALPARAAGASFKKCFTLGFLTSLPQPIASVPAALLVWIFEPLMLPLFGFAAGAMMYLVLFEMIPQALEKQKRSDVAFSFMLGFSLMVLVQVVL